MTTGIMDARSRPAGERGQAREAGRVGVVGAARARRDAELAREGWTRRFVGAPPRLREMTELYRELGHEVLLDPVRPDELDDECGGCVLALSLFRVIYTRSQP